MDVPSAEIQYRRILTAMPSYRQFLESTDDANATLDAWCRMLSDCEDADVIAVVDEITSGRAEAREEFTSKDDLPFLLRTRAMGRKSQRIQDAMNRRTSEQAGSSSDKKRMHRFMDLLRRAVAGDDPMAEILLKQEHDNLKATDDRYGPRYRCIDCSDTGIVPCLDSELVGLAARHGAEALRTRRIKTLSYACSCETGAPLRNGVQTDKYNYAPLPTYNESLHYRCLAWCDGDYRSLDLWLEAKSERIL